MMCRWRTTKSSPSRLRETLQHEPGLTEHPCVDARAVDSDEALAEWAARGTAFARTVAPERSRI